MMWDLGTVIVGMHGEKNRQEGDFRWQGRGSGGRVAREVAAGAVGEAVTGIGGRGGLLRGRHLCMHIS